MQQNAKIKISWGSGFIPSAKHTAQDKLISNLFIIIFSSQAIYYSLFISFFSCFFFYPHMSYVICLVPVISTLPTFEFQHIFIFFLFFLTKHIFIFIFTFMSLSQYHFSSSSISSSVPMPLL